MLIYYATLQHILRIATGVLMRTRSGIKKSVNVSLPPEVLEQARKLNINLSVVLTDALLEKFRENKRAEWLQDNASSIEAVNQWVEDNGSFSDFQRSF